MSRYKATEDQKEILKAANSAWEAGPLRNEYGEIEEDEVTRFPSGHVPYFCSENELDPDLVVIPVETLPAECGNHDFVLHVPRGRNKLPSYPVYPILLAGQIWDYGWEIPTNYLVDSKLQCWRDHGHGGYLEPLTLSSLIDSLRTHACESEAVQLEKLDNPDIKPRLPDWMSAALRAGWTPPASFDRSLYR